MVCYPYGYAQNNYSHSIGYSACSQRNRIPHRPDTDSDAAAKYLVAAEASKKALISFDYRHEISYFLCNPSCFRYEVIVKEIADTSRRDLDVFQSNHLNCSAVYIPRKIQPFYKSLILEMLHDICPIELVYRTVMSSILNKAHIRFMAILQALIEISQYLVHDNVVIILSHSSSISADPGLESPFVHRRQSWQK